MNCRTTRAPASSTQADQRYRGKTGIGCDRPSGYTATYSKTPAIYDMKRNNCYLLQGNSQ
jgi:hypothetical protein